MFMATYGGSQVNRQQNYLCVLGKASCAENKSDDIVTSDASSCYEYVRREGVVIAMSEGEVFKIQEVVKHFPAGEGRFLQ